MTAPTILGLEAIVPSDAEVALLDDTSTWAEGVVYVPKRNAVRWSDIHRSRILEHDLTTRTTGVYAQDVEFTNGRVLDAGDSFVQCSHGLRRIERERSGAVEVIVDNWNGVRFNSPNDVVIGPDDAIWFSDPPYGIIFPKEGHPGEREYGDHWVFRHDTLTGLTSPVVTDVEEPNGLAFSPDGSQLYVADSSALTAVSGGGNRSVRVYDVDGARCKNGRVFCTVPDGVPDGVRVDTEGRVWIAAGNGVHVYSNLGTHLGAIILPSVTANLCFGGLDGDDLFIASSASVYSVKTHTRDAAQRY